MSKMTLELDHAAELESMTLLIITNNSIYRSLAISSKSLKMLFSG